MAKKNVDPDMAQKYELIQKLIHEYNVSYFMAKSYLQNNDWNYGKARNSVDSYVKLYNRPGC